MQARLVVICGQQTAQQFDLPRLPATIGRSRSTDVTLGHPLVSRQHCEVFEAGGCLMVRDLGSLNGTFVGEVRLAAEAVPLRPGEQFSLGPVTLQAEYAAPNVDSEQVQSDPTVIAPLEDLDAIDED